MILSSQPVGAIHDNFDLLNAPGRGKVKGY